MKPSIAKAAFYSDLPDKKAEKWLALLEPITHEAGLQTALYEPWRDFECMYIHCEKDMALDISIQENMARLLETGGEIARFRISSGHSPWLSQPDKVIEGVKFAVKEGHRKKNPMSKS